MANGNTVTEGLLLRMEATPGKEEEIQRLLEGALPAVEEEPKTTAWFAIRMGPGTFGIFDVFPDESGREEHLSGRVARALQENAHLFARQPHIEPIDVLASKLPG